LGKSRSWHEHQATFTQDDGLSPWHQHAAHQQARILIDGFTKVSHLLVKPNLQVRDIDRQACVTESRVNLPETLASPTTPRCSAPLRANVRLSLPNHA